MDREKFHEKFLMDREKFQKIFSNETYQLPIFWDGEDFYATLYKHLKGYREDIEKNYGYDSDLCAKVKSICQGICAAVDYSFRGYPEKAYKRFESVMDILKEDPLLIDKQKIKNEKLYRVVDVGNAAKPSRQRLFHVPFSLRSKMSTQRYSIPGFPCLYLGTSVELCCAEIEKDPKLDYLYVSRYELQTDSSALEYSLRILINGAQKPVFDNGTFIIFDISIKPNKAANTMQNKDFAKYTKWYPLIAACSYVRAMRNSNYSAEHIIPQLFIQWLRSEYEEAVVGIKYFSCAPAYESTLGNNYVFPTMGTPYHARKTIADYCPKLSHRFKLTSPRLIMAHESIKDCAEEMDNDELEYIESCNADENEIIEGEYNISEGVSAIGSFAFSGCASLKSIYIPDSVTSIGRFAFSYCTSLTGINIPDSVTSIGDCSFSDCTSLTNITVASSNKYYTSVDGVLYNIDKTKLINYPVGKNQTSFTIPTSITSIGNYAFSRCASLTNIHIPDSVTSIGDHAFSGCTSLTNIHIPDSVTSIGRFAFSDCTSLTNINIPDSVTSIGDGAFLSCTSLTSINIPNSVTNIGDFAFSDCTSLKKIHIPNSVTSIGYKAFPDTTEIIR